MMRPVSRVLRRSAALLLLILPVYLAAASTAWGQYVTSTGVTSTGVTSTGVRCGDEIISFDTLNLPTEGANAARYRELAKLYAYASEAWRACDAKPDTLPGCKFLHQWREARMKAEPPAAQDDTWDKPHHYARRQRLRALDTQVIPQAMRVLAHERCNAAGNKLSPECVALVVAEAAAIGAKLCDINQSAEEAKQAGQIGEALAWLAPKVAEDDAKRKALADAKTKCSKTPNTCSSAERSDAQTFDSATQLTADTLKAAQFYGPKHQGCPDKSNAALDVDGDIEAGFMGVKFDRPTGTAFPKTAPVLPPNPVQPAAPAAPAALSAFAQAREKYAAAYAELQVYNALEREAQALRRDGGQDGDPTTACMRATYYVTPTGLLVENEELPNWPWNSAVFVPKICIDSSSFAIDRPFDVVVTGYPEYPNLAKTDATPITSRAPSLVVQAWPGEVTPLNLDAWIRLNGVAAVRITVRGYPRGVSLRALAQRGADGARIDGSYEATDLRAQARKVAEKMEPVQVNVAKTDALDALVTAFGKADSDPQKAITAMNDAVDAASAKPDAGTTNAKAAVIKARDAISTFLQSYTPKPPNSNKQAVDAAVVDATKALPPELGKDDLRSIKEAQALLKGYQATLQDLVAKQREAQTAPNDLKDAFDRKLARLCRISKELLPVVDEDVLIAQTTPERDGPGTYVIDYDYEAGFQRAPTRTLQETDRVYVRVRRVRPNEAVAIAINDKGAVQHAVSLVGYTPPTNSGAPPAPAATTDPLALSGGLRSGMNDLKPDQLDVQASSTQILALPGFDGARRYDFVLCALTDRAGTCPVTDGTKSRVIARNTLVVHAKRRLGVRAGLGIMGAVGSVRSLADVPSNNGLKYVRSERFTPDAAVPLLLTYYFIPRDAVDLPRGVTWGLGIGPDLVATFQAKPRIYLGLSLDVWGLGFTAGPLVEQRATIDAPEGSYVTTASTTKRWYGGGFLSMTTDLDIFEAVLKNYILTSNAPSVGNGGK